MSKTRWLLWSSAVAIAATITALSVVQSPQPEASNFDAPFILDRTNRLESVCPVHRITMYVAKVPVVYGLPVGEAVRAERFPHSRAILQAGCGVLPTTNAWVYVCPDCQRAENKWKLAQQQPK